MSANLIEMIETLECRLTVNQSRRGVAGFGLASLVTTFIEGSAIASHHGKKKKSCPKKRIKYFGCTKFTHNHCRKRERKNGANCRQNGQCFKGLCYLSPTCQGVEGSTCIAGDECCSGECTSGACAPGAAGTLCAVDGDCQSEECVGFHCT